MAEATSTIEAMGGAGPGGLPEAAAVIWDPLGTSASNDAEDTGRRLAATRRSGLLRALVAGAVAGGLIYFDFTGFGTAVAVFGGIVGLAALLSPGGLYAAILALFAWTGRMAGQAVGWLLLVPTFYLFFLPFGLVMRRGRRDGMRRFYEPEAATYWKDREERPVSSLERLY